MQEEVKKKKKRKKKHPFGRLMAFLGLTLLCVVITLVGVVWVFEKGPSPTLTGIFCNTVRETSAIRWLSNMFLSEEELSQYILQSTEDMETEQVNTSLIHIAEAREKDPAVEVTSSVTQLPRTEAPAGPSPREECATTQ